MTFETVIPILSVDDFTNALEYYRNVASHVYFQVSDVDTYYGQLTNAGVAFAEMLENRSYGMRDFGITDPSGNHLDFGSVIKSAG